MIVVADTSPINYLLLIDLIDLLPELYQSVVIPQAVLDELLDPEAPAAVRQWIANPSPWLEVDSDSTFDDEELANLDRGERHAIVLAQRTGADALIVDERAGRQEAGKRGIFVIGTLGVIAAAASADLIDLSDALEKLQKATFRVSPKLVAQVLSSERLRKE